MFIGRRGRKTGDIGDAGNSVARETAPSYHEFAGCNRLYDEDQVGAGDAARRERGLDAAEAGPRGLLPASSRRAADAAACARAEHGPDQQAREERRVHGIAMICLDTGDPLRGLPTRGPCEQLIRLGVG